HRQRAHPVDPRGLAEQRHGQQVAGQYPGHGADRRRDRDLEYVGRRPLRGRRPPAGLVTWIPQPPTTWSGEKPTDLSTPIRRVPATTAPLTTLATISTAITIPLRPNATLQGTHSPKDGDPPS